MTNKVKQEYQREECFYLVFIDGNTQFDNLTHLQHSKWSFIFFLSIEMNKLNPIV